MRRDVMYAMNERLLFAMMRAFQHDIIWKQDTPSIMHNSAYDVSEW